MIRVYCDAELVGTYQSVRDAVADAMLNAADLRPDQVVTARDEARAVLAVVVKSGPTAVALFAADSRTEVQ